MYAVGARAVDARQCERRHARHRQERPAGPDVTKTKADGASARERTRHAQEDTQERHRRRCLSCGARRSRRRLSVRQCRHRLRTADRSAGQGAGAWNAAPHSDHLPAREHRAAHGDRLLPGDRAAAAHHDACQCRHRERDERAAQRLTRQRAHAVYRRAHPDQRAFAQGSPQPRHSLDAGNVRPGRNDSRGGEMGLRAAQCAAGGNRDRPDAQRGHERSQGSRLPVAAARSAGLGGGRVHLYLARAHPGRIPGGARCGSARPRRRDPGEV